MDTPRKPLTDAVGPGLLVAATGVGAGDLATGAFSGSLLGTSVLWAVVVGAAMKFALTEGLTRWQLATGETLLEGVMLRVARPLRFLFLLYLLPWSWFVGSALISACGVTANSLAGVFDSPQRGKVVFGIAHSLLGLVLVSRGGYRLFERSMRVAIGLMFVTAVTTAVLLKPDWGAVLRGLCIPSIPHAGGGGWTWTVGLIGGVGGTLTVLCYGYWIREEGREGPQALALCRIDLAVGYVVTALFGLAMVVIGSTIEVEGRGAGLIVALADRLEGPLGGPGRWVFLLGAWAAVFSSLLGVWQAVPLVFADYWRLLHTRQSHGSTPRGPAIDTRSTPYRLTLFGLALIPLFGLGRGFRSVQVTYAVVGAGFLPLLALALLVLNGRSAWVGARLRSRPWTQVALILILVFFLYAGWHELSAQLAS
jgi:Mn2+/Fe2+ NRAMP family transporter